MPSNYIFAGKQCPPYPITNLHYPIPYPIGSREAVRGFTMIGDTKVVPMCNTCRAVWRSVLSSQNEVHM